jgi:hypothetical protein
MLELSGFVQWIELAGPEIGRSITRTSVAEVAQGDDPMEGARSITACESPATIRIEGLGTVD